MIRILYLWHLVTLKPRESNCVKWNELVDDKTISLQECSLKDESVVTFLSTDGGGVAVYKGVISADPFV